MNKIEQLLNHIEGVYDLCEFIRQLAVENKTLKDMNAVLQASLIQKDQVIRELLAQHN